MSRAQGRKRRYVLAGLIAVVAVAVLAVAAGATVVEKGTYSNPYSFTFDDCGFDVLVEGVDSGHYSIRAGKGKTDTAFFLHDNYSYSNTQTNVETGAFFTVRGHAVFNEIKATPVGGNIFEFEAVEAGQPFAIYDSAGNLVLRDRGSIHHHVLFDTLGDDDPGGVDLGYLGADVHGPHPGFNTDPCEIITPLIGP